MNYKRLNPNWVCLEETDLQQVMDMTHDLIIDEEISEAHRKRAAAASLVFLSVSATAQPLKDGACPKCSHTAFHIIARVDSWGTYLDSAGDSGPMYCEKCQQKIQPS